MELFDRKGRPIADWRMWTPPKDEKHWRCGRSAMELARTWFTAPAPTVPPEMSAILESRPETAGAVLEQGWPELQTLLPEKGEGRNHDLVLVGRNTRGKLLIAVEAKVDETMGPQISRYWKQSKRTQGSYAWRRIDTLLKCAFGESATALAEPWASLPYQLLTALAGTAIEAHRRDCPTGVLILHEFVTHSAKEDLLQENATAFRLFLNALGSRRSKTGVLEGPFQVNIPSITVRVPVLIGKVQYRWKPYT